MIKDAQVYSKNSSWSRLIPSKAMLQEYMFFMLAGLLFARVDFMGVINTFGYAWLITLFLTGRPTFWGAFGILAGRLTVINTISPDMINVFSDVCVYLGAYVLMSAMKKIYNGNSGKIYIISGLIFYAAAECALMILYEFTVYKALYVALNMLTIGAVTYVFNRVTGIRNGIDFNNVSQLDVIFFVSATALAVIGIGSITLFSIDIRMIIIYAVILISAYSYGAGTGALVGTVFGILLGIEGEFTLINIIPFTVCGVVCGILNHTNKIISGAITICIYGALFFLLDYGMTELHSFIEMSAGVVIYTVFSADILNTVQDSVYSVNSSVISTKSYADRVKLICCEKIDGVCNSTERMHKILESYLKDTEKTNLEQFNELTSQITQTVCAHCTMGDKCSFANNSHGKKNPSCEIARIVSRINHVGNGWRNKMAMYREVPAIAVGCVNDSITSIKKKLENSVKVDDPLTAKAEQQCMHICKYVDSLVVLNSDNGYEVIIQLKTASVTQENINALKAKCEDIVNVKFEISDAGSGTICFVQKAKYMISTGVVSVSYDEDGICGDACTIVPFGKSGFMMAVADGCGTGYPALAESNMAMELLETMAQCGCDEDATVSLINTLMGLRMDDDKYSTADICVFNKYNGNTKFIKMGAVCSFIVHNGNVATVDCGASPLGLSVSGDEYVQNYKLKADDAVIMMTDGVYDSCAGYNDPNEYFTDMFSKMKIYNAQETAQTIMENALRNVKKPKDDMLVFVAIVRKN